MDNPALFRVTSESLREKCQKTEFFSGLHFPHLD